MTDQHEVREMWAAALKSGEYTQTHGQLQDDAELLRSPQIDPSGLAVFIRPTF